MDLKLIRDVLDLIEEFQEHQTSSSSIGDFKKWIVLNYNVEKDEGPYWDGKDKGRTAESVISTLIIHMNRYAKSYSKSAMVGSKFSTQEDFIFLITLRSFGEMTKMDLIKKNVHEKPAGIQIINRLISHGWVEQKDSITDKRSKVLRISDEGIAELDLHMDKIRDASKIVTGNLSYMEKMDLISLLSKLEDFHHPIYHENLDPENLLDEVLKNKKV